VVRAAALAGAAPSPGGRRATGHVGRSQAGPGPLGARAASTASTARSTRPRPSMRSRPAAARQAARTSRTGQVVCCTTQSATPPNDLGPPANPRRVAQARLRRLGDGDPGDPAASRLAAGAAARTTLGRTRRSGWGLRWPAANPHGQPARSCAVIGWVA
jgi:hypothetical protein